MKETMIVGVDVSKSTLDICFKPGGYCMQIANSLSGFKQWFDQCKKLLETKMNIMIVMEHTGQYSFLFESFLRSRGISYCKVPALQIKRSLGVTRGKNDKVDAQRIAEYGWLRREILKGDKPAQEGIQQLKHLLSLRAKMVRDRSGYSSRLKEMKATFKMNKNEVILITQEKIITTLSSQIKRIEKQINEVITAHEALDKTRQLLKSIKGIGGIIAAYMIVCTDNFQRFSNARKFNCYAGLAPFKYESGSSIKGRTRISHLANKEAKTLLNLAAFCAIRHHLELKQYYQKRVQEGKTKMACINIIRSKLVSRMFAVIKRQTPFQELPLVA